jgi:hypothetical protein
MIASEGSVVMVQGKQPKCVDIQLDVAWVVVMTPQIVPLTLYPSIPETWSD